VKATAGKGGEMSARIVIGVDGSDPSRRAVDWCTAHARAFDAEIVAVHAVEVPTYVGVGPPYIWLTSASPEQREAWRDLAERDWCKPLADAGVTFRVVVRDGDPASVLMEAAEDEDAALVVVGRRGRGGFKKLLLGSTSHHLSHHLDRPIVIVP
jgi:nucleotide-binding universal stress UspA family protein